MHILVVDDDMAVRTFLGKALRARGHSVVLAANGAEGLSLLCDAPPAIDAVVLDLVMPEMDGWATFRAIRALKADAPVVLVSGYDALGVGPLLAEGAVAFLQKPFAVDELLAAIAKANGDPRKKAPRSTP